MRDKMRAIDTNSLMPNRVEHGGNRWNGCKSGGIATEKLIDSLHNLRPLVGTSHEMYQGVHVMETSDMASSINNLHAPMDTFAADNLHELLVHTTQNLNPPGHPDFLAGLREGVLAESNDTIYRHLEAPKAKWANPSPKLNPGPFWMLQQYSDQTNLTLPSLAGSGSNSPKVTLAPPATTDERSSQTRQVWCDRSAKQGLMKSEGENGASQKLQLVAKIDKVLVSDASPALESPSGNAVTRDASDMDGRQVDSSDCSDHNMDEQEEKDQGLQGHGMGRTVSKNLVSERKRRKKLNDGLYTLRALVPKISKMDKASIVGDAIDYVRELQKQVEDLQADISDMETSKSSAALGEESLSSVVGTTSACQAPPAPTASFGWEEDTKQVVDEKPGQEITPGLPDVDPTEQKILELDVAKMEEQTYHLRIFCTKGPGVFVQLMQSLEALGLEVVNANLTSFQENILNTFIAEIKDWEMMKTEEVKKAILEVAARFGLQPQ